MVVEHQQHQLKNNINHDLSPWCGLNTLNNNHFYNKQFIDHLATNIVYNVALAVPLLLVRQAPASAPLYNSMERPPSPTLQVVSQAHTRTPTNPVGFLYHPILLMNDIRGRMLSSGKVTFTSPLHAEVQSVVQQYRRNNFMDEIVVLDFMPSQKPHSTVESQFLVDSNLFNVQFVGPSLGTPLTRLPSAVLWLPSFKASTSSNGGSAYTYNYSASPNSRSTTISIQTSTSHSIRDDIVMRLDLFMALGTGDFALQVINQTLQAKRVQSVL